MTTGDGLFLINYPALNATQQQHLKTLGADLDIRLA